MHNIESWEDDPLGLIFNSPSPKCGESCQNPLKYGAGPQVWAEAPQHWNFALNTGAEPGREG
jgi:hypothetical protein